MLLHLISRGIYRIGGYQCSIHPSHTERTVIRHTTMVDSLVVRPIHRLMALMAQTLVSDPGQATQETHTIPLGEKGRHHAKAIMDHTPHHLKHNTPETGIPRTPLHIHQHTDIVIPTVIPGQGNTAGHRRSSPPSNPSIRKQALLTTVMESA